MGLVSLTPGLAATPPLDGLPNLMNWRWLGLFRDQSAQIAANPSRVATTTVSGQTDTIPTTPIGTDPLAGGLYRLMGYLRVTSAAVTSSSVSVTIRWSDGGVACSRVLIPAVTGNTVDSTGTGVSLINVDAAAPVSYSTTYASNGANEMEYELFLTLESMGAN